MGAKYCDERLIPCLSVPKHGLLSDYLRDPSHSVASFRRDLKTFLVLLAFILVHSASGALRLCAI